MSDTEQSHRYRFSRPGGIEIEVGEFTGDDTAEARAHELSKSNAAPVIIHRNELGDDWEYITEVDDRPSV